MGNSESEVDLAILNANDAADFAALIQIFTVVFERADQSISNADYLKNLLSKPDFFVVTAKSGGKVVGGLTVYILHGYHSTKPTAYIYDVGVTPELQGRGIGKKLIRFLIKYCRARGFDSAYVEAEADDAEAIAFYRKTPYNHELQAVHFNYESDIQDQ